MHTSVGSTKQLCWFLHPSPCYALCLGCGSCNTREQWASARHGWHPLTPSQVQRHTCHMAQCLVLPSYPLNIAYTLHVTSDYNNICVVLFWLDWQNTRTQVHLYNSPRTYCIALAYTYISIDIRTRQCFVGSQLSQLLDRTFIVSEHS